MENTKYYTPTIDEFYVGFEYEEINIISNKWCSETFQLHEEWLYIDNDIKQNTVRVKYLDKEDIESLGWNCETTGYYTLITKYQNLTLRHMEGNVYSWVGIYSKHDLSGTNVLFDGSIKNKSELKKLMQQLIIK